ncbi:rhodanese-like domain-containing protein [Oceanibaculum pacificum]|uniref:Rhodanese domain-containing protein n=1 Tax=Oceanibaculum pacificum TaxID=580166 RepID=A0A154W1R5_9PROT|nr:hypothetical protein [Oceanibaculum pacificum]KZD07403.1 hypothetical protein AUP43_02465 [Oceanibaculum pacificum]
MHHQTASISSGIDDNSFRRTAMNDSVPYVTVKTAWEWLSANPNAVLIDVRCEPEWRYAGVPVLDSLRKRPLLLSWLLRPYANPNPDFRGQLIMSVLSSRQTLLFLSRTGRRSAAAVRHVLPDFPNSYSIRGGFEGPRDDSGHRGRLDGWKAAGLPWRQD